MQFSVRKATLADMDALHFAYHNDDETMFTPDVWRGITGSFFEDNLMVVTDEANRPLGFSFATSVYVLPGYRGYGCGSALVEWMKINRPAFTLIAQPGTAGFFRKRGLDVRESDTVTVCHWRRPAPLDAERMRDALQKIANANTWWDEDVAACREDKTKEVARAALLPMPPVGGAAR